MKMTAREQRMLDAMNRRRKMDEKEDELEDDAEMRARLLDEAMKKRAKGGGKFSMRPPMEMED